MFAGSCCNKQTESRLVFAGSCCNKQTEESSRGHTRRKRTRSGKRLGARIGDVGARGQNSSYPFVTLLPQGRRFLNRKICAGQGKGDFQTAYLLQQTIVEYTAALNSMRDGPMDHGFDRGN